MDNSVEEIIKIYEEALEEIKGIAHVSEGRAAAFYGMLAENALKKAKEQIYNLLTRYNIFSILAS